MGYERYPRSAGGNDDRDQQRGYGRDDYGPNRGGDAWNAGSTFGDSNRDRYENASYGDRAPRYDRYDRYDGPQGQSSYGNPYGQRDQGRDDARSGPYGNRDRGQPQRQQGRPPQGYDYDDRGFFDRAGDEVRSWFGDEEANRRRDEDARRDEQRYGTSGDDHYHNWRRSQIDAFDRDYHEYRQENRQKFDSEFASWRNQRQTQRSSLSQVREHQEVVGSDGIHVGTVDKVRGDRIILTKNDTDAGGRHHSIPSRWIQSVDDKVTISKTAEDAHAHWRDEERNGAFFNEDGTHRDPAAGDGPHVLGRSFSGTY